MSTSYRAVAAQDAFNPDGWFMGIEPAFGGEFNPNPEGQAGEMPIDDYVEHLSQVMVTSAGNESVVNRATSYYFILIGAQLQGAEKVQWG